MEGWVDLGSLIAARPGIEPKTAWSLVRRPSRYATESPIPMTYVYCMAFYLQRKEALTLRGKKQLGSVRFRAGLSHFMTRAQNDATIISSIGPPEVARHDVKNTSYFETGQVLRSWTYKLTLIAIKAMFWHRNRELTWCISSFTEAQGSRIVRPIHIVHPATDYSEWILQRKFRHCIPVATVINRSERKKDTDP